MTKREAYIALNLMEGIGPVKVRALITALGSVEAVFDAGRHDLLQADGIGPKLAESILEQVTHLDPAAEEAKTHKLGAHIVTQIDDEYPAILKEIHDPPLALYVMGNILPTDKHSIAVIGSRKISHYGRQVADRLSFQLGKLGYTVVSGLARGIDTAAHMGALKGKGRTIAVLGSALDCLYPTENEALAQQIVESGAVISEFPLGTQPNKTTFPMRNRIVSGLSMGVLVVEAARGSGAMITVDEANAQGRLVFAVPGRIDMPGFSGCHYLLKNGATLVEDVDDITRDFEYLIPPTPEGREDPEYAKPKPKMNANEEKIISCIPEGDSIGVDQLIRDSGVGSGKVNALLIGLEMKRMIRMLPGRRIERL
ncbi:MAG: DNA processing protein [Kiritimatiellia bacterium]|jgi:DNA processing protein